MSNTPEAIAGQIAQASQNMEDLCNRIADAIQSEGNRVRRETFNDARKDEMIRIAVEALNKIIPKMDGRDSWPIEAHIADRALDAINKLAIEHQRAVDLVKGNFK